MKRIKSLLGVTRRAVAHSLVFCGAAGAALGTALIYVPAGVILGGVALVAWSLLIFDIDES